MRRLSHSPWWAAAACLPAILAGCPDSAVQDRHGLAATPLRPAPVRPFAMGRPDVVVLITGGDHGLLEVCNCSGSMAGGLSRRSGLIRSYRAAFEHTVAIDSGDVVWVEPEALQNRYVLKGYRQIGYDAVVLGDHEWMLPQDTLAKRLAEAPQVYLSTTVRPIAGDRTLPLTDVVRRQWGDVKLATVSTVSDEALLFVPESRKAELSLTPTADLAGRVRQLKADGYVVVLICHGDEDYAEACAKAVDADLIVRGDTARTEEQLLKAAGKPMVKVGGTEFVGAVALQVRDGRIAALEYRAEVIDTRWPLDQRLMQTYQAYAHVAMRAALDAERKKGLDYQPSAECGKCHEPVYRQWAASRHAKAYETLVKADRTYDPNCLTCHTAGFGMEKGFTTIEKTRGLAGVNCQNCHRFDMKEHWVKGFQRPPVTESVCASCHSPITDPKFANQFAQKLAKIRCPRKPVK